MRLIAVFVSPAVVMAVAEAVFQLIAQSLKQKIAEVMGDTEETHVFKVTADRVSEGAPDIHIEVTLAASDTTLYKMPRLKGELKTAVVESLKTWLFTSPIKITLMILAAESVEEKIEIMP